MFGSRRNVGGTHSTTTTRTRRWGRTSRTNPNRRAAGLKAALHNPNTTHAGRKEAKYELRAMGRGREAHGHPSLKSRIKRFFGIRSHPRSSTTYHRHEHRSRRY